MQLFAVEDSIKSIKNGNQFGMVWRQIVRKEHNSYFNANISFLFYLHFITKNSLTEIILRV